MTIRRQANPRAVDGVMQGIKRGARCRSRKGKFGHGLFVECEQAANSTESFNGGAVLSDGKIREC